MIKTVTTTTGVNTVTFDEFTRYFWIKNIGENAVNVSAYSNVSPAADNTSALNSGDIVRIENVDNPDVYIYGESTLEIHAIDDNICPFKVVKKGGESNVGIYPLDIETGLPYGDITVGNGIIALVKTFKENTAITSAKLTDSLKTIGSYAFYNCTNLKTVDFAQVEEIGEYTFKNSGITSAIFPETLKTIGNQAFTNCTALTRVYIPAGCTNVAWNAFSQDTALLDFRVGVGFNADLTITYVGNNKITAETINAIIANYADNSGKTLTMGSTYLAKLTDDDKAVASAKGLTLA